MLKKYYLDAQFFWNLIVPLQIYQNQRTEQAVIEMLGILTIMV
jgi:hypothetical protein